MKPYLLKFESLEDFYEANDLLFELSTSQILQVIADPNRDFNGVYCLFDTTDCKVTEERNGAFELVLNYPENGEFFTDITLMSIILAKANPYGEPQYFRISRITKPINGLITVYCYHISYDLSGVPVMPFSATNAGTAITGLQANAVVPNRFSFWTDKTNAGTFTNRVPSSLRSLMGGQQGSILDVYGGEWEFDNYSIKLHNQRGANRGVRIAYGKNLLDLTQEEECANVYTAVCPYWATSDGTDVTTLPEKIIQVEGTFTFTRVLTLDLSSDFDAKPTAEQLRNKANAYIAANGIGVPKVSLKVSYIDLAKTEEYKDTVLNERVDLCDTVMVQFAKLGVNATAKCIKTVFDVLTDRYESIELGDARSNFAAKMAAQTLKLETVPTTTAMQQAVERATQAITGNMGGYVVLRDADGNGQPDEILIMDTPDVNTAQKVWRWNSGGLGYSSTGVDGSYGTAITASGEIVADFITTGLLNASLIKTGTIANEAGTVTFDVTNGIIKTTGSNNNMLLQGNSLNLTDGNGRVMAQLVSNSGGLVNFYDSDGKMRTQINTENLFFIDTAGHNRVILNQNGMGVYDTNQYNRIDLSVNGIAFRDSTNVQRIQVTEKGMFLRNSGGQNIVFLGYDNDPNQGELFADYITADNNIECTGTGDSILNNYGTVKTKGLKVDGHTCTFKSITINGTSYHLLGY